MTNTFRPGKYKHYKGGMYTAFCLAEDKFGNKYVLYRQESHNHDFWIRPVEMFTDQVDVQGVKTERFAKSGKSRDIAEMIKELAEILKNRDLDVYHSESKEVFCIPEIETTKKSIAVSRRDVQNVGGYLSEYALAGRMEYSICKIDGNLRIIKGKSLPDGLKLIIGDNREELIKNFINPCSIDLQIAESGYLRTRHKKLDIGSIAHPVNASELWKPIRIYKDSTGSYIKLKPRQTVITHTKERISIPNDCAGKIEVKSTYARLSLSVTMGDFCNPGYCGYFPLEISNHGNHTIILHAGETMAQLMLMPLVGPIINRYAQKATFRNNDGIDDGNPYTFYRERALKQIRKQNGAESVIVLYQKIYEGINAETAEDMNAYRARFENNFLTFCQRKMKKEKYLNASREPDIKILCKKYIERERRIKRFWNIPIGVVITAIVLPILGIIAQLNTDWMPKIFTPRAIPIIIFIIVVSLIFYFKKPKEFCTLEKIDIDRMISSFSE